MPKVVSMSNYGDSPRAHMIMFTSGERRRIDHWLFYRQYRFTFEDANAGYPNNIEGRCLGRDWYVIQQAWSPDDLKTFKAMLKKYGTTVRFSDDNLTIKAAQARKQVTSE